MDVLLTGFIKKPLVAIILLVISTMCLSMAEAAPTEVIRMRHTRRSALYKDGMTKILNRFRFTIATLEKDFKALNEQKEIKSGNPKWIPKMKFVDIHRRNHGSIKHRFKVLVPNLFTHLNQFKVILEQQYNVTIDITSNYDFDRRKKIIDSQKTNLNVFIQELMDTMEAVNMKNPKFDKDKMNLAGFKNTVNGSERKIQDYIVYRAYSNMLKNWKMEFRCPGGENLPGSKSNKRRKECEEYNKQIKQKRKLLRGGHGATSKTD